MREASGEVSRNIPVCCNFYVQCHLDIKQILILPQVTSHLTLCGPQLILQLCHAFLSRKLKMKVGQNYRF